MNGYSISFIPKSWAIGKKEKPNKVTLSLGPLRFSKYTNLPTWDEAKAIGKEQIRQSK